jgi:hypothetical protein
MSKQTLIAITGGLACVLLVTGVVLAMSSTNYRLDWITPLTGSGGGAASSDHYAINFTVGQTVIGTSDSSNYVGCLGYWCGGAAERRIYLPLVLRSFS